ncbi:hypothetical protein AGMMS50239_19500 [Bacteroidia bacterium]|nr:hypothetical protein AGMMS50239_19500 [Bacteroidia bacterium]
MGESLGLDVGTVEVKKQINHMKKQIIISLLFVVSISLQAQSPFGIHAHINGGEFRQMPQNIELMQQADIRWVRVDFNSHFDRTDRIVEETGKHNLQIMGVLSGGVSWANPHLRLDEWTDFIEKIVMRYKDKVRHWEVWNEQNLFWINPDGADYAALLKATYKKIKEIDPELTVLYGGTSGIPMSFIEKSFAAGAADCFDGLNIHPYRGRMNDMQQAVQYEKDLENLRALMDKYNVKSKRLWITEMGYSTVTTLNPATKDLFRETVKKKLKGKEGKIAILYDDDYPTGNTLSLNEVQSLIKDDFQTSVPHKSDLATTDLTQFNVLLFPLWENYPVQLFEEFIPPIFNYMLRGGNVCFYGNEAVTESDQALYLSQSILLSLRFGIERFFCYELQSPEDNPFEREDHFGLTHKDLTPKPAYYAYSALCKLFPEGSVIDTSVEWKQKDVCVISWTQKNGARVWALWSPDANKQVTVKIGKGFQYAVNELGEKLPVAKKSRTLPIGQGITYLVGAKMLEVR